MAGQSVSYKCTAEEMVQMLLTKDEVFNRYFTLVDAPQNLGKEAETKANRIFKETFPDYPIKDFEMFYLNYLKDKTLEDMQISNDVIEPNEICSKLAYDPSKRGLIRMPRVNNSGRGKREKFNLGEFLKTKRENGDFYQLSVGDREMVENLMEDLSEDKPRNDQRADVALNRMVEMAAVLNGNCSYKIMELHSERRIQ